MRSAGQTKCMCHNIWNRQQQSGSAGSQPTPVTRSIFAAGLPQTVHHQLALLSHLDRLALSQRIGIARCAARHASCRSAAVQHQQSLLVQGHGPDLRSSRMARIQLGIIPPFGTAVLESHGRPGDCQTGQSTAPAVACSATASHGGIVSAEKGPDRSGTLDPATRQCIPAAAASAKKSGSAAARFRRRRQPMMSSAWRGASSCLRRVGFARGSKTSYDPRFDEKILSTCVRRCVDGQLAQQGQARMMRRRQPAWHPSAQQKVCQKKRNRVYGGCHAWIWVGKVK